MPFVISPFPSLYAHTEGQIVLPGYDWENAKNSNGESTYLHMMSSPMNFNSFPFYSITFHSEDSLIHIIFFFVKINYCFLFPPIHRYCSDKSKLTLGLIKWLHKRWGRVSRIQISTKC